MAIVFVTGKPRSGKSYWSFHKLLVNELRVSKRKICTNIHVRQEELAEQLQRDYGSDFDVRHRLRILTDQESLHFWRFWGPGIECEKLTEVFIREDPLIVRWYEEHGIPLPDKAAKPFLAPDFTYGYPDEGVHFLIDEVHVFFNARRWQSTGDEALYAASQHAKLTQDWALITQNLKQVDSQLRGVAQEFHYLRNHAKEKSWGGFIKSPSVFSRRMYLEPFTGASGQQCEELRFYKLNLDYAKCYKTEAGVGIVGKLADMTDDKRKGLPAWSMAFAIVVCLLAIWKTPAAIGWVANKFFGQAEKAAVASVKKPLPPARPVTNDPPRSLVQTNHVPFRSIEGTNLPPGYAKEHSITNKVRLTGVVLLPGKKEARVYLSDGRVFTNLDPELQLVSKTAAIISGKVYTFGGD